MSSVRDKSTKTCNIWCYTYVGILSTISYVPTAGQPTHIIYPAESGPLAYHSMTAGQLAIASPRYSSSHIGYHGSSTPTTTEALQQLTHFSSQSTPLRYVTNPQNTGYHSSTFQPRPVQGLAYGPVVQSSIQVATPIQYISPARPMQQAAVGYGTPIVPSTTSHYSPVQPPTQQPLRDYPPIRKNPSHPHSISKVGRIRSGTFLVAASLGNHF